MGHPGFNLPGMTHVQSPWLFFLDSPKINISEPGGNYLLPSDLKLPAPETLVLVCGFP
jgi:hypothetical protein